MMHSLKVAAFIAPLPRRIWCQRRQPLDFSPLWARLHGSLRPWIMTIGLAFCLAATLVISKAVKALANLNTCLSHLQEVLLHLVISNYRYLDSTMRAVPSPTAIA